MTDKELQEAIESIKSDMRWLIGDANEPKYQLLLNLAQLYLSTAGKMPKEIPPETRIAQPLCEISFNKGRIQGYNQARQDCILAFAKREQRIIKGDKMLNPTLFQTTLALLQQCDDLISEYIPDLSDEGYQARKELIELCKKIAGENQND